MNPVDIAHALLLGIPFATYVGLHHGLGSFKNDKDACRGDSELDDNRQDEHRHTDDRNSLVAAVARSQSQIAAAHRLVCRRYAWRGYSVDARQQDCPPYQSSAYDVTFVVESKNDTVGTATLGVDGPDGLLAERTHDGVIARARAAGCRVGEVTRLAVAQGADSCAVFALLLNVGYLVAHKIHELTDVFIEVNPRHVAFYCRALGFVVAARERICERVRAPSVLLHAQLDMLEHRLKTMATHHTMRPMSCAA